MSIIITTLIFVVAIPSVAIDILLPALPEMATFFEADIPQLQFLLSSYTFIISTFAILYGPLIDRFGRKKMALVGLFKWILYLEIVLMSPRMIKNLS